MKINYIISLIVLFLTLNVVASSMPEVPIQLVKPDAGHKQLVVNEENLKYLHQIHAPIVVVSVVGPFHSGKSFLMNQLMLKKAGFGVGPSVKPTTMGIWMWGKPVVMIGPHISEPINVIFLDTEGFAANNVSENYDAKIFAVTTLLSSHLLFNTVKIINQADIDYLEVLSRQTQLFALRSQMSKSKWLESLNEDLLDFPPLTWVVQDFVQATESGESPSQWLRRLMSTHTRENDEYKISLLDIFKQVDCHTLFLPATKKALLQNLNYATEDDLTLEYREERDLLIEKIKSNLKPKSKSGRFISGVELSHLLKILVSAANDGNLASVPSRWESFMESLLSSSVTACVKFYEDEMKNAIKALGINDCVKSTVLSKSHEASKKKTQELLKNLLKGLPSTITSGQQKLDNYISLHYEQIRTMNEKKVKLQVNRIKDDAQVELEEALNAIELPLPSEQLTKKNEKILVPIWSNTVKLLSRILEEDELSNIQKELSKALSMIINVSTWTNEEKIQRFLEEMIDGSLVIYNKTIKQEWTKERPLHPDLLAKIRTFATEEALQYYLQVTREFKNEKFHPLMKTQLEKLVSDYGNQLDIENEELAEKYISSAKDTVVDEFIRKTSPETLHMPLEDESLDQRLVQESDNALTKFKSDTKVFEIYKSHPKTLEILRKEISELCDRRRSENIDAFTKEVIGPLEDSLNLIIISESKYSTVFSFRRFIDDVYMEILKKGTASTWPTSLKLRIINNFVENNDKLSQLIVQKDGFWSRIVGSLEYIYWFVTKIIYFALYFIRLILFLN